MALKLVRRESFGWPAHPDIGTASCDDGLVVHYDGSKLGLAGKTHSACVTYWKNTRRFHMGPERGWADIGYSYGVCPHGYVFEGRGWKYIQAAQPGGNSTWTSCTFMTGDGEQPTRLQLEAFGDLRAYLRGKGLASRIKGHRNFISTSCPGSVLYKLVADISSALYQGISSAPAKPAEPTYWRLTVRGRTVTVPWATPYLREGSDGVRVEWLQEALNADGARLEVDGDFGKVTGLALRAFQSREIDEDGRKLAVDGVYGHHTARSLYIDLGGKKEDSK